MKQDFWSAFAYWYTLYFRDDRPKGFSRLRRLARAAEATEPELAKWMKLALKDIESGADPQKALSLSGRRGRPTASKEELRERIGVGARVQQLRGGPRSYETAVADVAEEQGKSESWARRCYKEYCYFEQSRPLSQFLDAGLKFHRWMFDLGSEIERLMISSGFSQFLYNSGIVRKAVAHRHGTERPRSASDLVGSNSLQSDR